MKNQEFKKYIHWSLLPVLSLEKIFPHSFRRLIKKIFRALIILLLILVGGLLALEMVPESFVLPAFVSTITPWFPLLVGALLILLSFYLLVFSFEAFYYSFYFRSKVLQEKTEGVTLSFGVASILSRSGGDVTKAFIRSPLGSLTLLRSGIDKAALKSFLSSRKTPQTVEALTFKLPFITLRDFARVLYQKDEEFAQFLFSYQIQEDEFAGGAEWVERFSILSAKRERWWSRNNLGRISGIGKDWSYGSVYLLEKYGKDITTTTLYTSIIPSSVQYESNIKELETTLTRGRQSNILIVGDGEIGKTEIIAHLAHKIEEGRVAAALQHKRVIILDGAVLITAMKEKGVFEERLLQTFNQAVKAGNIILVLKNFPTFMESARSIDSDIVTLLQPYFTSPGIQIIATSGVNNFHKVLESRSQFMEYFEVSLIRSIDEAATVRMLEIQAERLERQRGVLFTYPAVVMVARSADRYFTQRSLLDKGLDLLEEVIGLTLRDKRRVVTKQDVLALIEAKTGIPLGEADEKERGKLLNLESVLHERVIGQNRAIEAVSKAMRRSRAGVRNQDRPMGSFLFLGPTGVGKTETAKALAEAFFGGEKKMMRLDMSEYRTADALSRLIGSFEGSKQGRLVAMLKQQQYGVLLLDEFEKTNKEVLDLFLQIFDEGQFSDMTGKKINARNIIIIATSNAASDLIWEHSKEGEGTSLSEADLVDEIIKRDIFKPELLNRFDGVIVFDPIDKKSAREIALLLLNKLQKRLKKKGVSLLVNDDLVDMVVRHGYNVKFGARPMKRAIQERVEQVVADKMIREGIAAGTTIELSPSELE